MQHCCGCCIDLHLLIQFNYSLGTSICPRCSHTKKKKNHIESKHFRSSHHVAAEINLTRNHEVSGSSPSLAQWVGGLALLWLWCRLAAVAPIRPLAWEPPYAGGAAQEVARRQKKIPPPSPDLGWVATAFLVWRFLGQLQQHQILNPLHGQRRELWPQPWLESFGDNAGSLTRCSTVRTCQLPDSNSACLELAPSNLPFYRQLQVTFI